MIVVSFHGRQSQGVEAAVSIMARAAVLSDMHAQSVFFPTQDRTSYVWGLVKMDKNPILSKQKEPHDFTLFFDPELEVKEASNYAKDGSVVVFNTTQKINTGPFRKRRIKTFALDATGVGIATIKKPVPNTAMLGALAKMFNKISMKVIKSAAEHLAKENSAAIEEGYKNVKQVK